MLYEDCLMVNNDYTNKNSNKNASNARTYTVISLTKFEDDACRFTWNYDMEKKFEIRQYYRYH